jgi:hypothetical protein
MLRRGGKKIRLYFYHQCILKKVKKILATRRIRFDFL